MNLNLNGLNIVVTGGSLGIGASIVKEFAKEGANVMFCARNQDKIDLLLDELASAKGNISALALDVNDEEKFSNWIKGMDKIDIFVPNVSALSGDWKEAITVDMQATIANIQVVLPWLEKSNCAAITYIGSKASSFPTPGLDAYGATKAAMTHYMKTLSKKLMSKRVRVNVVSPGDTFFLDGFWDRIKNTQPEIYQNTVNSNPMGRLATPDEIAKVVVFISSSAASFVSGSNWIVDGGATNHIQL